MRVLGPQRKVPECCSKPTDGKDRHDTGRKKMEKVNIRTLGREKLHGFVGRIGQRRR